MSYEFPPNEAPPGHTRRSIALCDCIGMLLRALGDPDYDDAAAMEAGMVSRSATRVSIGKMYEKLGIELRRVK